jgi:hypothetical protein
MNAAARPPRQTSQGLVVDCCVEGEHLAHTGTVPGTLSTMVRTYHGTWGDVRTYYTCTYVRTTRVRTYLRAYHGTNGTYHWYIGTSCVVAPWLYTCRTYTYAYHGTMVLVVHAIHVHVRCTKWYAHTMVLEYHVYVYEYMCTMVPWYHGTRVRTPNGSLPWYGHSTYTCTYHGTRCTSMAITRTMIQWYVHQQLVRAMMLPHRVRTYVHVYKYNIISKTT